jgi:hypothetical protein
MVVLRRDDTDGCHAVVEWCAVVDHRMAATMKINKRLFWKLRIYFILANGPFILWMEFNRPHWLVPYLVWMSWVTWLSTELPIKE